MTRIVHIEGATSWIAALAPPVTWSVHFLLCYLVTSQTDAGAEGVRWSIAGLTIAALVIIATAWLVQRRDAAQPAANGDGGSTRFLGLLGQVGTVLFATGVLFTALPVFFLDHAGVG
jgi:hypothetical protein